MMKHLLVLLAMLVISSTTHAKLHTEPVEYKVGDTACEGYLAYDDALAAKAPGVLVVHDWMGVGPFAKKQADRLAELGYVAFVADIYGKETRPANMKEASAAAGKYKADRKLLRERAAGALAVLAKSDKVDSKRLATIGYCFGGTTALELARSGADILACVSFHGGLDTPTPDDAKNIKAHVLVMTGADDPNVPTAQVQAFEEEMRSAKVDWQLISYGNAVHSFTNPAAGNDNSKGVAYNEKADKRSWETMKDFFKEIFATPG